MISSNYIQLKDTTTGEITAFRPNISFKALPSGEFINLNEARITDDNSKVTLRVLKAGEKVGEAIPTIDLSTLTKSDSRQILMEQGKAYPKKATAAQLIAIINA